jgi:hypothetical protein
MINSGAMSANTTICTRCKVMRPRLSVGLGMLGWMATHVHENIVIRQLQMMFQIVLPSFWDCDVHPVIGMGMDKA